MTEQVTSGMAEESTLGAETVQVMTEQGNLAQRLGLDEQGQIALARVVAVQHRIDRRLTEIETLMDRRYLDVLALISQGVSRYRLAHLLGLSQTTLSNIVSRELPAPSREDPDASADGAE